MRELKSATRTLKTGGLEDSLFEVQPIPVKHLHDTVQCLESKVVLMEQELSDVKHLVSRLKAVIQTTHVPDLQQCSATEELKEMNEEQLKSLIFRSTDKHEDTERSKLTDDANKEYFTKPRVPRCNPLKVSDIGRAKISALQRLLIASISLLSESNELYSQDEENGDCPFNTPAESDAESENYHQTRSERGQEQSEVDDASEVDSSDLTSSDSDDVTRLPFRLPAVVDSVPTFRIGKSATNKMMGKSKAYKKYGTLTRPVLDLVSTAVEAAHSPVSKLKLMKSL